MKVELRDPGSSFFFFAILNFVGFLSLFYAMKNSSSVTFFDFI